MGVGGGLPDLSQDLVARVQVVLELEPPFGVAVEGGEAVEVYEVADQPDVVGVEDSYKGEGGAESIAVNKRTVQIGEKD